MGTEDVDSVGAVRSVLARLSAAVAARDAAALAELFEPSCLLVGTTGHAVGEEARTSYVHAVVTQPGQLSWDWRDVLVCHAEEGRLVFLALGELILTDDAGEQRSPIRISGVIARRGSDQWRFAHFHGSSPAT